MLFKLLNARDRIGPLQELDHPKESERGDGNPRILTPTLAEPRLCGVNWPSFVSEKTATSLKCHGILLGFLVIGMRLSMTFRLWPCPSLAGRAPVGTSSNLGLTRISPGAFRRLGLQTHQMFDCPSKLLSDKSTFTVHFIDGRRGRSGNCGPTAGDGHQDGADFVAIDMDSCAR